MARCLSTFFGFRLGRSGRRPRPSKRFALELDPHNIPVNAVAPGFVRTDMTQRGRGARDWQGTEESFAAKAMMGRIGEPEDPMPSFLRLARIWLDHGTDFDRGWRTNGLHWTRLVSQTMWNYRE
jgi:NAD(P)-dependent dehydrogenase (short-subunit alcohol dehydrogenase family)